MYNSCINTYGHVTPERPVSAHLAPVPLRGLEAAAAEAAVGCGTTAADDLQLFFCAVCSVQQLLNELLQTDLGVSFPCRRLLEKLVNLSDFSKDGKRGDMTLNLQ